MVKIISVTVILFILFTLTGCQSSEDLLDDYKDFASPDLINDGSISKMTETINVAEHFNLTGEKNDPFYRDHFAVEVGGLKLNGRDDIVSNFGIPNQEKQEEWVGGQLVTSLEYEFAYFIVDNSSQRIVECGIWADAVAGPRGVRIGDSVSSVIGKFYYEDEISVNEPDQVCVMAMENECCALLYQLQPDSLVGLIIFDRKTGDVTSLLYGMHYGQHCGVSWLWFEIVENRVSAIWFNAG